MNIRENETTVALRRVAAVASLFGGGGGGGAAAGATSAEMDAGHVRPLTDAVFGFVGRRSNPFSFPFLERKTK